MLRDSAPLIPRISNNVLLLIAGSVDMDAKETLNHSLLTPLLTERAHASVVVCFVGEGNWEQSPPSLHVIRTGQLSAVSSLSLGEEIDFSRRNELNAVASARGLRLQCSAVRTLKFEYTQY